MFEKRNVFDGQVELRAREPAKEFRNSTLSINYASPMERSDRVASRNN
jgi:hypothetical protein